MSAVAVTQASFADAVVAHSQTQPVLLYFWASWCAPCRQMGPLLERLAESANGSWALCKVSTETEPELTQACDVTSLPTLRIYKNGAAVAEMVDAAPKASIATWLAANI